jgi:hypothetical protein
MRSYISNILSIRPHTYTQVRIKLISGKLACEGAQASWQLYGIWTNKYNH